MNGDMKLVVSFLIVNLWKCLKEVLINKMKKKILCADSIVLISNFSEFIPTEYPKFSSIYLKITHINSFLDFCLFICSPLASEPKKERQQDFLRKKSKPGQGKSKQDQTEEKPQNIFERLIPLKNGKLSFKYRGSVMVGLFFLVFIVGSSPISIFAWVFWI